MPEFSVMLVDDEPLARSRLRRMLSETANYIYHSEAENGVEAVRQFQLHPCDIVLMDIRMPGQDGLETARQLSAMATPPAIIFCTAYDAYAMQAFEAMAVDYLLKPIRQQRLELALAKAGRLTRAQLISLNTIDEKECLSIKTHRGLDLIPLSRIRCFIAEQKYVTVVHDEGEVLTERPLKTLMLDYGDQFIQIHRNAMVARQHIEGLEKDNDGHYRVRLQGVNTKPLVSRRMLASVRAELSG
ncbi:MAG: LytTR family DNA-binding domain-containing protein [Pseudomonadales bacterium]